MSQVRYANDEELGVIRINDKINEIEELVDFCKKQAASQIVNGEMPSPIILCWVNGRLEIATLFSSLEFINAVKEAALSLNPEWFALLATPEYEGKPCLYVELHVRASDRYLEERRLYDIIASGEDVDFEMLEIEPELCEMV